MREKSKHSARIKKKYYNFMASKKNYINKQIYVVLCRRNTELYYFLNFQT